MMYNNNNNNSNKRGGVYNATAVYSLTRRRFRLYSARIVCFHDPLGGPAVFKVKTFEWSAQDKGGGRNAPLAPRQMCSTESQATRGQPDGREGRKEEEEEEAE